MTARPDGSDLLELDIDALGAQGDGIAVHEGRSLFVPYTAPGDRVRARRTGPDRALPVEWLTRAPDHAAPPCPHFGPGKCGGCALQHLDDEIYARWKVDTLARTLAAAGLEGFAMRPLARTRPGERRRADLLVRANGRKTLAGFHVRKSREAVDVGPCPILVPALESLLPALREFFAGWPPTSIDVLATAVESGVELVLTRAPDPDLALRERVARFAAAANIARIARRSGPHAPPDILVERHALRTRFGNIEIDLPPATFLQASVAGERAIVAAVAAGLGPARRVADLFAGCGSIALALAGRERRILAADRNGAAIAALDAAVRRAGLAPFVRAETRDLNRRPLIGDELRDLDAVIFDPPREGAAEQARALAASCVPVVVAVSCNPATFARDAKVLVAGGYRLVEITPVDQFLWSPHLELVGIFRR